MRLPKLMKTPSYQRFLYKPRFWNEKQEELENRIRDAEARRDGDLDAIKASVASTFRKGGANKSYLMERKYRSAQVRRSNMRLVLIIAVLCLLVYVLIR
ncbi:MAG: hypothetical protein AAF738_03045 [Bacteroidota bacterium]